MEAPLGENMCLLPCRYGLSDVIYIEKDVAYQSMTEGCMWNLVKFTDGFIAGRWSGKSTQVSFRLNLGDCGQGAGDRNICSVHMGRGIPWGVQDSQPSDCGWAPPCPLRVDWHGEWEGLGKKQSWILSTALDPLSLNPFFFFWYPPPGCFSLTL